MPEKIGDALKRAISQENAVEDVEKSKKGEEPILMNPTRLEIFQLLCKNPCSRQRAISKILDLSVPTVEWHLNKLCERGFIRGKSVGKNKVYYPTEMIDPKDIDLLAILSGDKARLILSTVAANPGINQTQLGKEVGMYQQEIGWYTAKLAEGRILSQIKDGRYKRYYINEELDRTLHWNLKRRNHFKKSLLKALKIDGANPEIIRGRGDTLVIQISSGNEKMILRVNLNLVQSFLQVSADSVKIQ